MSHTRRRSLQRVVAATSILIVAWLVGCSLLVPNDVPEFKCTAADPGSCPSGMACDPSSLTCVSPASITEAGREDRTTPEDDARSDNDVPVDAGPQNLGAICAVDPDCKSELCGTSTILTTAIVPTGSKPICTKPCCTSADCDEAFICFASGTGGNYCVSAERAKGDAAAGLGEKTPGQECDGPSECRSGTCVGGRCQDTCCAATDCAPGSTCRVETIDTHIVWACGEPNPDGGPLDASCNLTTECANDNCVTGTFPQKRCTPSCCKSADCVALGFKNNVCAYGNNGSDQIKWCFEPIGGTAALGAACNAHTDCLSRYCDPELRKCMSPCCTDDDCAESQSCRPSPSNTPFLRCVDD